MTGAAGTETSESVFSWRGCVGRALAAVFLLGVVFGVTAKAEDRTGTIEGFLGAGEFAPAVAAAQRISDPALRDGWLGRIARRQARFGARQASLSTLASIQSDLARRDAVESMADRPVGAAGGAAIADFDTLIELITSTIAPDTWDEVGGAGAIEAYPNGVFVDSRGVLKKLGSSDDLSWLDDARRAARHRSGNTEWHAPSGMRKVSLTRLEKQMQLLRAIGQTPDDAMRHLAGIYSVSHLFVYPDTGDVVIAGPASDWRVDADGREVSVVTGQPVLQLDDLLVVLRNAWEKNGQFGCSIKPKRERLAATKAFALSWQNKAIKAHQRESWINDLRTTLGKQDVEVWGIDPRTRTARVIVEADYHMKRVGMGLEPGTLGVVSYLEAAKQKHGESQPSMSVLRWWFTLNYAGIEATTDHLAFRLDGPGVKVLSENELLTETGRRIHTGESEELNRGFARSFTHHFDAMSAKYPLYAELKNVFDLALVAALLRAEDIPAQLDWHMTHFRDAKACPVSLGPTPKEIDSIINSIELSRSKFIAGVSGGVSVDTQSLVKPSAIRVDSYGAMDARRAADQPGQRNLDARRWWWD